MVISPVQSHHRGPPSEHGMEESMDWQPDFHAVVQDTRDPKAEVSIVLIAADSSSYITSSIMLLR